MSNAWSQTTLDTFKRIDVLVNNAGITRDTLIMRMSEDDWDAVIDTNLKSAFLVTEPRCGRCCASAPAESSTSRRSRA